MSDLQRKNAEAMVAESRRLQRMVEDLSRRVVAQDAKISTLSAEVASLKRAQVLASIQAQKALLGHGGTSGNHD